MRFAEKAPAKNELRVVTWNVGYFAPVTNKNLRDVDTDRVVKVLEEIIPDVIVLQELGELEQAESIAKRLGPEWNVFSAKTGHGDQVSAILSKRSFERTECFSCGGRMTPGVSIETGDGTDLYVAGVHSPHPARGIDENEESIRCVLEHAREHSGCSLHSRQSPGPDGENALPPHRGQCHPRSQWKLRESFSRRRKNIPSFRNSACSKSHSLDPRDPSSPKRHSTPAPIFLQSTQPVPIRQALAKLSRQG